MAEPTVTRPILLSPRVERQLSKGLPSGATGSTHGAAAQGEQDVCSLVAYCHLERMHMARG